MDNLGAVEFENVKVFAADPWHKAQPGSIRNLKINVKGMGTPHIRNKLTNLRIHVSQVHFTSNNFDPIHFVLEHFRFYTCTWF